MENIHDARMSANDTANNIGVTASAYSALAERYNKSKHALRWKILITIIIKTLMHFLKLQNKSLSSKYVRR